MQTETVHGIEYQLPKIQVIQDSPLLVAEYAGRIAYDSFSNSEHKCIRNKDISNLDADSSDILTSLAWVHHHHSVLEHLSLTYLIEGTSRGVLQELVRHRIASYTVRSTRYTMSSVINAFVASLYDINPETMFIELMKPLDLFVTTDVRYNEIQIRDIYTKLMLQKDTVGWNVFLPMCLSKDAQNISVWCNLRDDASEIFEALQKAKKKRNVGDAFKHIVNDNWKVDMVVTFNLRSLKNYFQLRDSGAAFFQIRWLAQTMKQQTPSKYLDLIVKSKD